MKNNKSREAFYERINQLADSKKLTVNETSRNLGTLIDYKRATNGIAYGIIKENHNYYIKKAGLKQDPNVSDFAYIGGLSNITNYQYTSLGDADKNRSMLLQSINESNKIKVKPNTGKKLIFENVVEGAEEEIGQAEDKLGDAETASQAETTPEATSDVDAGAIPTGLPVSEPETTDDAGIGAGEEETISEPEATPDAEGISDGEAAPEGEEETTPEPEGIPDGEANAEEGSEKIQDLKGDAQKLSDNMKKADLEDSEMIEIVNQFLGTLKPEFKNMDISDRKQMANKILKVVSQQDIDDVATTIPQDNNIEENADDKTDMCVECGGFGAYAESRGYNEDSIKECDNEELASVISGYANAHNDGQNNGDFKLVAILANPEILNLLKGDYGHEDYVNKLTSDNEESDDENLSNNMTEPINEVFSGLWNAGKTATAPAKGIASTVKSTAQQIGTAVKGGFEKAKQGVGQYAADVKQSYHSGELGNEFNKIQSIAQNLSDQVNALSSRLQKAGKQPINVQSLLQTISSGIQRGNVDLSKFKVTSGVAEGADAGMTEVQPNTGFAPPAQSLGVVAEGKQGKGIQSNVNIPNTAPKGNVGKNGVVFKKPAGQKFKTTTEAVPSQEKFKANPTKDMGIIKKANKPNVNKKVDVVKNSKKTDKPVMSENEQKLRKYIRARLEEKAGLRKPMLNESTKPEALKKLDKVIDEQFKLNEGVFDMFSSNASKFEKLNPTDVNGVNNLFNKVFSISLQMAARKQAAMRMSPEEKYNLLKQGYETDKFANPSFKGVPGNYLYSQLKVQNPFAGGGTGGNPAGGTTGA